MSNPFYPSYGISPKVFLGRESVINSFIYGLENGFGDPNRSTAVTGARGSGKTVVLKEIENKALSVGWISVYSIMKTDLLEDILDETKRKCKEHCLPEKAHLLTGIAIGQLSVNWQNITRDARWETRMYELLSQLTEKDIGIIFQIDEIHGNSEELRRFAAFFQQYRDKLKIALVMAGVPHQMDSVFNDKVISFLRRSRLVQLGMLDFSETKALLRKTFETSEKTITDEALELLSEKSGGFPFLIQLLGYEAWEIDADEITVTEAKKGIQKAERHIGNSLIELILQDLSPTDRKFVYELAKTDTPAKISTLAEKTGFDRNKLNQYRRRLDREGVVYSPERGRIDFVIPYMKDYLTGAN